MLGIGSVPRPRGDEPEFDDGSRKLFIVFPARAGMNQVVSRDVADTIGVPRPRGDEPNNLQSIASAVTCSPPARG